MRKTSSEKHKDKLVAQSSAGSYEHRAIEGDSWVTEMERHGSDKPEFTGQVDGDALCRSRARLSPSVFWMY